MPPAKRLFADGQGNNGRQKRTVNRPAEVAMGRKDSYTAGPDGNAARHTDARSLAIPVPRGTMIPSAPAAGLTRSDDASPGRQPSPGDGHLRRTTGKVYASRRRLRTIRRRRTWKARGVPNAPARLPKHGRARFQGRKPSPADRVHGVTNRRAGKMWTVGTTRWKNLQSVRPGRLAGGGRRSAGVSRSPDGGSFENDGNLGMVGKPRKFLLFSRPAPPQTP